MEFLVFPDEGTGSVNAKPKMLQVVAEDWELL